MKQNTSFAPRRTNRKTRTLQHALQLGQFDHPDDDMFPRIRTGGRVLHFILKFHLDHDKLHLRRRHACVRTFGTCMIRL